jgi:ABC-type nitrate/sulfonate/bicarbonate transport system permease component
VGHDEGTRVTSAPIDIVAAIAPPVVTPAAPGSSRWRRVGDKVVQYAVSLAVVLGAWQLFLTAFHINSFIGRSPLQVWRYLTSSTTGGTARSQLYHASVTTLHDAALGLIAGTAAALVCAIVFNLRRTVEQTFMPIAMVLRSVPLVAMTPLIALVFGRGLMGVTVIAGIVTFFPTLVNVTLALRATPQASLDLFQAYGAGQFTTLRKVQLPSALPSVFASLRIAAPLALIGALLAEWLATGRGLGYLMLQSETLSNYNLLWAATVLVTAYSVFLYTAISGVEKRVLVRFSDTPV